MSRSLPLAIDTTEAVTVAETYTTSSLRTMSPLIPSIQDSQPLQSTTVATLPLSTMQETGSTDDVIDTNVIPYEYPQRSSDAKNSEGIFTFSWNSLRRNKDITSIEPLQSTNGDLLAILSSVHRPLLFGMTAGVVLLMFLLLFFACPLRHPRHTSDKAILIAEDFNVNHFSLGPAQMLTSTTCGFPSAPSDSSCKSPATCSRHTPRV